MQRFVDFAQMGLLWEYKFVSHAAVWNDFRQLINILIRRPRWPTACNGVWITRSRFEFPNPVQEQEPIWEIQYLN